MMKAEIGKTGNGTTVDRSMPTRAIAKIVGFSVLWCITDLPRIEEKQFAAVASILISNIGLDLSNEPK